MSHVDFDISVLKESINSIIGEKDVSDRRLTTIVRRLLVDFKCDDIDVLMSLIRKSPDIWEKYFAKTGKKILVVEDSDAFSKLIEKLLVDEGYQVYCAKSGEECMKYIREEQFDLITMDIELPDSDGYELAEEIGKCEGKKNNEEFNCSIPIVMITSRDTIVDREKGFRVGASDFVVKSLVPAELTFVVGRILDSNHQFAGMKVLVVDSMAVIRKIVATMLRAKEIDVLEATTGEEAYEIIAKHRKTLDLVVTSYGLEGMSGVDLCQDVRKKLSIRSVPMIMITAEEEREPIISFFKVGGSDYLRKSFIKEELEARLFVHLESRYFYKKLAQSADVGLATTEDAAE